MITPFCTFCQINGINGPHDHFVRANKEPNAKVTCPMLLSTICGYCGNYGHTAKFCKEAKASIVVISNATTLANIERITPKKSVFQQNIKAINHLESKSDVLSWADIANGKIKQTQIPIIPISPIRPTGMSWADWDEI
jgi:hypothetical protein